MPDARNDLGPYKATKLWNDIVRVFRSGMPIGRRWRQFRSYDDCFVASEAVDWLHDYLKQHHEYGPEINRSQVIKLLQKFHRHRYIEDVRGEKYNSEQFQETNRLFRFVALSPLKTPQWPRQPLSSCTNLNENRNNLNDIKAHMDFKEQESNKKLNVSSVAATVSAAAPAETSDDDNIGVVLRKKPNCSVDLWKTRVLQRLERVLAIDDLSEMMDSSTWKAEFVKHNMTVLHKNGYVTGILKSDLPPSWVISAMRFLSKWPEKGVESFPEYPGFEKDVFNMIKDYFDNIKEPLTTFDLCPAIIAVYKYIARQQPSPISGSNSSTGNYSSLRRDNMPLGHDSLSSNQTPSRQDSRRTQECNTCYQANPDMNKLRLMRFELNTHEMSDNRIMILYDTPKKTSPSSYYTMSSVKHSKSEPWKDHPSYQVNNSYRTAVDHRKHNINWNCNNNNDIGGLRTGMRRRINQRNGCNMHRAKSFSDILNLPRVETAFVGDDAYTVYHGVPRHRVAHGTSAPITKSRSVYGINKADTGMDDYKAEMYRKRQCLRLPLLSVNSEMRDPPDDYLSFYEKYHSSPRKLCRVQSLKQCLSSQPANLVKSPFKYATAQRKVKSTAAQITCHSTPAAGKATPPLSGMFDSNQRQTLKDSLRLLLLFLPAANRRVLHMLLKLMNKIVNNSKLVIDSTQDQRQLVLSSLWRPMLRGGHHDGEDSIAQIVCEFLVDNYEDLMMVPFELRKEILDEIGQPEAKAIKQQCRSSIASSIQTQQSCDSKGKAFIKMDRVFCERITAEQYKYQASRELQNAMSQLLNDIINDKKMNNKEKSKKLKQRAYPETFATRIANDEALRNLISSLEKKEKTKQLRFTNPIGLLRKLR